MVGEMSSKVGGWGRLGGGGGGREKLCFGKLKTLLFVFYTVVGHEAGGEALGPGLVRVRVERTYGRGDVLEGVVDEAQQQRALAHAQGLTLVHFSAQLERFPWDEGCV